MIENFITEYPTFSLWVLGILAFSCALANGVLIGKAQDRQARIDAQWERWRGRK